MGLYNKPALDLLGALINRDNPGVKTQLSSANIIVLGGPYTTSLGVSGRNSRIQVNGVAGSGINGKMEFFYDRLNLGDLFRNITVVFEGNGSSAKIKDLLPSLNAQYGLNLVPEDLANGETALDFAYTASPVTFTIAATSLAYRGTLTATWSRKPAGIYPDSGPGSKVMLQGDMSLGYFGQVSQAELVSVDDLYAELFTGKTTTAQPIRNAATYWLKFAVDGKIRYFPSRNIITGISWNEIKSLGHADATARFPQVLTNESGEQFFAQLRLPTISSTEITPGYRGDATGDVVRLFNKVHKQAYGTGEWDGLTTLDLTSNFWEWNRRADTGDVVGYQMPMNQSNTAITLYSLAAAGQWRPFLELVDGKLVLVPVRNIQAKLEVPVRSFPFTIISVIDSNMLQAMKNVTANLVRVAPPPVLYRPTPNVFKAAQNFRAQNPIRSIAFSVSATYDTRINLATTDGELIGF